MGSEDSISGGRVDAIGPEFNTNIPGDQITSSLYARAYGLPPAVKPIVLKPWSSDMNFLTTVVGRPLTRDEYEAWTRLLLPEIYFGQGATLTMLLYVTIAPWTVKRTNFPFIHKGPSDPFVFPSVKRPWVQGRAARGIWSLTRVGYVWAGMKIFSWLALATMKSQVMDAATKEPRLAHYFQDRRRYSASFTNDLNLSEIIPRHPDNTNTRSSGFQVQLGSGSRTGDQEQKPTKVTLVQILEMKKRVDEELNRRLREGTWHRLDREEYRPTEQSTDDEEQEQEHGKEQSWGQQPSEGVREEGQSREQQQQPWQYSDRHQDDDDWHRPPRESAQSWDQIRQAAKRGTSSTTSSFGGDVSQLSSSSDRPSRSADDPWDVPSDFDDGNDSTVTPASVAPRRRSGEQTTKSSWDRIRGETYQRRQQSLQAQRSQRGQQGEQAAAQGWEDDDTGRTTAAAQQQPQKGSSWNAVRNRSRPGPEQDHTYTEEQRRRETAKEQAQSEFDAMIERERKASQRSEPGKGW